MIVKSRVEVLVAGPGYAFVVSRSDDATWLGSTTVNVEPDTGFALDLQLARHAARQVAADRETQAHTLPRVHDRPVELHERIEDHLETFRRDADARVVDARSARGRPRARIPP